MPMQDCHHIEILGSLAGVAATQLLIERIRRDAKRDRKAGSNKSQPGLHVGHSHLVERPGSKVNPLTFVLLQAAGSIILRDKN